MSDFASMICTGNCDCPCESADYLFICMSGVPTRAHEGELYTLGLNIPSNTDANKFDMGGSIIKPDAADQSTWYTDWNEKCYTGEYPDSEFLSYWLPNKPQYNGIFALNYGSSDQSLHYYKKYRDTDPCDGYNAYWAYNLGEHQFKLILGRCDEYICKQNNTVPICSEAGAIETPACSDDPPVLPCLLQATDYGDDATLTSPISTETFAIDENSNDQSFGQSISTPKKFHYTPCRGSSYDIQAGLIQTSTDGQLIRRLYPANCDQGWRLEFQRPSELPQGYWNISKTNAGEYLRSCAVVTGLYKNTYEEYILIESGNLAQPDCLCPGCIPDDLPTTIVPVSTTPLPTTPLPTTPSPTTPCPGFNSCDLCDSNCDENRLPCQIKLIGRSSSSGGTPLNKIFTYLPSSNGWCRYVDCTNPSNTVSIQLHPAGASIRWRAYYEGNSYYAKWLSEDIPGFCSPTHPQREKEGWKSGFGDELLFFVEVGAAGTPPPSEVACPCPTTPLPTTPLPTTPLPTTPLPTTPLPTTPLATTLIPPTTLTPCHSCSVNTDSPFVSFTEKITAPCAIKVLVPSNIYAKGFEDYNGPDGQGGPFKKNDNENYYVYIFKEQSSYGCTFGLCNKNKGGGLVENEIRSSIEYTLSNHKGNAGYDLASDQIKIEIYLPYSSSLLGLNRSKSRIFTKYIEKASEKSNLSFLGEYISNEGEQIELVAHHESVCPCDCDIAEKFGGGRIFTAQGCTEYENSAYRNNSVYICDNIQDVVPNPENPDNPWGHPLEVCPTTPPPTTPLPTTPLPTTVPPTTIAPPPPYRTVSAYIGNYYHTSFRQGGPYEGPTSASWSKISGPATVTETLYDRKFSTEESEKAVQNSKISCSVDPGASIVLQLDWDNPERFLLYIVEVRESRKDRLGRDQWGAWIINKKFPWPKFAGKTYVTQVGFDNIQNNFEVRAKFVDSRICQHVSLDHKMPEYNRLCGCTNIIEGVGPCVNQDCCESVKQASIQPYEDYSEYWKFTLGNCVHHTLSDNPTIVYQNRSEYYGRLTVPMPQPGNQWSEVKSCKEVDSATCSLSLSKAYELYGKQLFNTYIPLSLNGRQKGIVAIGAHATLWNPRDPTKVNNNIVDLTARDRKGELSRYPRNMIFHSVQSAVLNHLGCSLFNNWHGYNGGWLHDKPQSSKVYTKAPFRSDSVLQLPKDGGGHQAEHVYSCEEGQLGTKNYTTYLYRAFHQSYRIYKTDYDFLLKIAKENGNENFYAPPALLLYWKNVEGSVNKYEKYLPANSAHVPVSNAWGQSTPTETTKVATKRRRRALSSGGDNIEVRTINLRMTGGETVQVLLPTCIELVTDSTSATKSVVALAKLQFPNPYYEVVVCEEDRRLIGTRASMYAVSYAVPPGWVSGPYYYVLDWNRGAGNSSIGVAWDLKNDWQNLAKANFFKGGIATQLRRKCGNNSVGYYSDSSNPRFPGLPANPCSLASRGDAAVRGAPCGDTPPGGGGPSPVNPQPPQPQPQPNPADNIVDNLYIIDNWELVAELQENKNVKGEANPEAWKKQDYLKDFYPHRSMTSRAYSPPERNENNSGPDNVRFPLDTFKFCFNEDDGKGPYAAITLMVVPGGKALLDKESWASLWDYTIRLGFGPLSNNTPQS